MKKLLAILLLFTAPALSQNAIYVFPPAPRTPVGGIQSITAVVTGNANKTVNWSASCGKLIGSGNTIGLKSAATEICNVTATMAADGTKTASSKVTFEEVRKDLQAAAVHPRIGLTPADVADLQAKATPRNIAYTRGLAAYFATRKTYYDAHFCWTGVGCGAPGPIGTIVPTTGWIDSTNGFESVAGGPFETDTALFALMALIDPATGSRKTWAAHAHDLSMWEMNEICYNAFSGSGACVARSYSALGGNSNAPFIGSQFILNNRAQTNNLPQLQAIDWNYSSLTSADKAVIAQVGHIWGKQLAGAYEYDVTSGVGEHIIPVGAYNSPAIINQGKWQAESGSNNYAEGHFQSMVAIGLLLDPADDPAVSSCASSSSTICASDGSAKTVGAYGVYAVKGWLYRLYANFEDQHIVNSAYGLSDPFLCPDMITGTTPCTGNMSGGFPGEGTGYGSLSMTEMFEGTYTLYTAGKLNPSTDVQASFISSSYWDKMAVSLVDQLYPYTGGANGGQYTQIGSDQSFGVFAQHGVLFNDMTPYDAKYGSTWRKNIDKWYQYNILYGGNSNFFGRFMGSVPFGGGSIALLSPNIMEATSATNDGDFSGADSPNPTQNQYDPRNTSTLPLDFENLSSKGGFYRYYGRDSWSATATQFQFGCHTALQDHASPACGRFDYLRKGEPLTTALGGTSNNDGYAQAPTHQNLPAYQWNPSFDCNHAGESQICEQGGMIDEGEGIFSSVVLANSSSNTYYYGATDASGVYNSSQNNCQWCSAAANVTLSQREVLWLKPDQIFIYDRANTKSSTSFKNFYMDLQTSPAINGNQAIMTSTKGQKLFVTVLLPSSPSLSASALDAQHEPGAPVTTLLMSKGGTASVTRMLHLIEGKDSVGVASATSLVQSSAGTNFDGGVMGSNIVMFRRTLTDTFTSTTYAASGATKHYITGLAPNATYTISGAGTPASTTADSGGVIIFAAAGAGVVTVTATVVIASSARDEHDVFPTQGSQSLSGKGHMLRRVGLPLFLVGCAGCVWIAVSRNRRPKLFRRHEPAGTIQIQS